MREFNNWKDPVLLAPAGAALGAAFWPGGPGAYAWIGLVPLLWVTRGKRPGAAFVDGTAFGAAAYAAGLHYLSWTIRDFLGLPAPAAVLVFLAWTAANGVLFGLLAAAAAAAAPERKGHGAGAVLFYIAVVVAAEAALEAYFPKLIPWHLADTQVFHLPTAQCVEIAGPAGLSALIAGTNAAAVAALGGRSADRATVRWGPLAAAAAILASNEAYGRARIEAVDADVARQRAEGTVLAAALVQGSMPRGGPPRGEMFPDHTVVQNRLTARALERESFDLVVWPESTYPGVIRYDRDGSGMISGVRLRGRPLPGMLRRDVPHEVPMLISAIGERRPAGEKGRGRRTNAALLTGPKREFLGLVEKSNLIPFGETFPLGRTFPFLRRLSPRSWDLAAAEEIRLLTLPGGTEAGVLICYEDFLAGFSRRTAARGARVFLHLSNDAWFGRGLAPEMHLMFARLRAVENRLFLLRAVNAGVTAVVDPAGRVAARLPQGTEEVLRAEFVPLESSTPSRFLGGLPGPAAVVFLLFAAWVRKRSH